MTTLIGRCSSCKHSRTFEQLRSVALYCRAHPAVPMLVPTDRGPLLTGVWPPVRPEDECGDWRAEDPLLTRDAFKSLRRDESDA